jgi:hypothetical protein
MPPDPLGLANTRLLGASWPGRRVFSFLLVDSAGAALRFSKLGAAILLTK